MLLKPISLLSRKVNTKWIIARVAAVQYGKCKMPKKADGAGAAAASGPGLVRAERSGKCRLVFLPEEWFKFFEVKTGVSGFYVLLFGLANYCLSKEIYVMEHEYYTGLSIIIMLWVAVKKVGPGIAATLDKEVDDITDSYYQGRNQDIAMNEGLIAAAQLAQKQAQGQKMLMDAKKENVLMQLEAVYRERAMHVYRMVKGRMDYHMKLHEAEGRIHQKWMVGWILQNVMKSITPEFEQSALTRAIKDIEELASRA